MEGYSDKVWGLTASYTRNSDGNYSSHQNNDLRIITPTAALSSFPFTSWIIEIPIIYMMKRRNMWYIAGPYDAFHLGLLLDI
jgi:hypothetical protein